MDRLMQPGRESETGEWVRRFLPNANYIIDIGANVGQSLIQYRSLYPDAEYFGGWLPRLQAVPVCCNIVPNRS